MLGCFLVVMTDFVLNVEKEFPLFLLEICTDQSHTDLICFVQNEVTLLLFLRA